MTAMDDMDLVREYATRNSEQAFAAIVSRHINLVYSVALRHAGNNPHQAQDITQAVFIVLARKAGSLRRGTVLSGWLFQAARLTASNFLRTELRRSRREQEAYMQSTLTDASGDNEWKQIAPLLDTAIAGLGEKDRNAIVLRFVEGKDLKEVGLALGTNEEAAKKRVSRAVDKLRGFFTNRGVTLSGAALTGIISANALQAAPVGLATVITSTAMQGAVTTASTLMLVKGTLKLMAWTKLKIAVGVGVAALVAYQWHENATQIKQMAMLQEQLQQARQQVESGQSTIEQLKQQKLVMVDEKLASEKAANKILAHQRAAFEATTAKNAALANGAENNSSSNALGKMMNNLMADSAMKEILANQQMALLKAQYASLFRGLNLSPETKDKFLQLLSNDASRKLNATIAMMKGDVDSATAKQTQADAKVELGNQLQAVLGADGYTQYENYTKDLPAQTTLKALKDQLVDNPLTDEQSSQLLQLMRSAPTSRELDKFDPTAVDQYLQQEADSNQQMLQQAANFLSPEQLAKLGDFQTNMLKMQRLGLSMSSKMLKGK